MPSPFQLNALAEGLRTMLTWERSITARHKEPLSRRSFTEYFCFKEALVIKVCYIVAGVKARASLVPKAGEADELISLVHFQLEMN